MRIVRLNVRAVSRPGEPLTWLAGPFGRWMQSIATKEYLRALSRFVGHAASH
ncbi:MAG: DUF1990 family protein [Acidimicrobiales bacterium]